MRGPLGGDSSIDLIKLFAAFAVGLLTGVALCGAYIVSLRAKIRLYRNYIQERIDKSFP